MNKDQQADLVTSSGVEVNFKVSTDLLGNAVAGGNVSGQVANALVASTVYTND